MDEVTNPEKIQCPKCLHIPDATPPTVATIHIMQCPDKDCEGLFYVHTVESHFTTRSFEQTN